VWPIVAGTSLAARIRRLTFAVFGLAAVSGLALVAFVAQTGYPVLSVPPLPLPGPELSAPGDGGVAFNGADGSYAGVVGLGVPGAPGTAGGGSEAGTLSLPAIGAEGTLAAFGSTGPTESGLESNPGETAIEGEQHTEVTAVTPAQQPPIPPESALASVPVEGSSTSSGLFVRTSVAPGLGEEGDVADSAPLPPDEPEIPYEPEPEPPAEPAPPVEPEFPVEPEPEPEVPTEPEPPVETPVEGTNEAPPVEEPAAEVPAG